MNRLIQHTKNSISWHILTNKDTFKNMDVFYCKQDEEIFVSERSPNRYQIVIKKSDDTVTAVADFPISNTIIIYQDNQDE